jgi:sugar (pentulose or hexulose) kinase
VGDGDVWKVVRERVRIDRTFAPDPARAERYDAGFDRFRGELVRRGYL